MNSISTPEESTMGKIRVLDPILQAGLPTIRLAVELKTKANPNAPVSLDEALERAGELKLSAVNLRTECPPGQKMPTGFHREMLGVPGHPMDLHYASHSLHQRFREYNARGLRIALMESSSVDHWNAIAGVVIRFGRLVLAGEVNLTPGLTHREAITSGSADPSMIRDIETSWFGHDRARLYRILKNAGQIGVFYEVICIDDSPRRILFYDVAKDTTKSHGYPLKGAYTDSVRGLEAMIRARNQDRHHPHDPE